MVKYLILNPLFVFGFWLITCLGVSFLKWTSWFPSVSFGVVQIYMVTGCLLIIFSFYFHVKLRKNNRFTSGEYLFLLRKSKSDKLIFLFLILFFSLETFYSGYLPIFVGDYKDTLDLAFGFPGVHGLYLGYLSYVSVAFFQKFLSSKSKNYLFYVVVINAIFILIARRGTIVFNLLSYIFLYLYYVFSFKKINLTFYIKVSAFIFIFFYGFNMIGNMRLNQASNDYILNVGGATKEFKESPVPKSFFYGYLYLSTPVSLFDFNLKNNNKSIGDFIEANIIPDFITKRLGGGDPIKIEAINGFNVGGFFSTPYLYKGKLGVALALVYYFFLFLIVWYQVKLKKKRSLVTLSLFLSLSVLLTFTNLLNSSGYIIGFYLSILLRDFAVFNYAGRSLLPIKKRI